MIRNYFQVIHNTMEKIIIGNTQPAHDVRWKSTERLTSRTYKEPSGYSQGTNIKIDDFMKKLSFRSNSPFITYLFLFFTGRTNVLNVQKFKSSTRGRPRDVCDTQLRDVHGVKWWNVLRTSVGRRSSMLFKLNAQTH